MHVTTSTRIVDELADVNAVWRTTVVYMRNDPRSPCRTSRSIPHITPSPPWGWSSTGLQMMRGGRWATYQQRIGRLTFFWLPNIRNTCNAKSSCQAWSNMYSKQCIDTRIKTLYYMNVSLNLHQLYNTATSRVAISYVSYIHYHMLSLIHISEPTRPY